MSRIFSNFIHFLTFLASWTQEARVWLKRVFIEEGPDLAPLRHTLKSYTRQAFKSDFLAAINVALLTFPQGMAYALIAGLPVRYGIYSSIVACVVGSLFAGSRFIVLAPTNATAILILSSFSALSMGLEQKVQLLPTLLFMVGFFLVVGAYLKIAHLIQYVSRSVVTGYIVAAVVLMLSNQVRTALGFQFAEVASTFYDICTLTIKHLRDATFPAIAMSLSTGLVYYFLNKRFSKLPNVAICLVLMSLLAYGFHLNGWNLQYLGSIEIDRWKLGFPQLNFDDISLMANAALAIALMSMMEGASVGKSLAARSGASVDMNQEVFSMGVANIAASCASGMPISGSLTRSTLNWTSGAFSPLASLYCALVCLVALVLIGPFVVFIPRPALSVLVMFIGVSLINPKQIRIVVRATKADAWVFYTTCIAGLLFPLDTAIYLGVGTSIVFFLKKAAEPEMVEYKFDDNGRLSELGEHQKRPLPEVSIVHVEGNLFFGAAELFREQIRRVCQEPNLSVVILRLKNAHHMDATSVMALEELLVYMREHKRTLILSGIRKDLVRILKRSGLLECIGRENIFFDVYQNPTQSTARALRRAQALIGTESPKISIYTSQPLS